MPSVLGMGNEFVTPGDEKSVILMDHYFWSSWPKKDTNSRFLNKIKYAKIPMDRYVKSIFDYSPETSLFLSTYLQPFIPYIIYDI